MPERNVTRPPQLANQPIVRNTLRWVGLALLAVGVYLAVTGFLTFANGEMSFDGAPDGFLRFGAGGLLAVIGAAMTSMGFMRATARYSAGEALPVAKESLEYLTNGQGLTGIGRTAAGYCAACGDPLEPQQAYCEKCGQKAI